MKSISLIFLGIAVATAFLLLLIRDMDAPVLYVSNSKTQETGERICAFVDTNNGKQPCGAFTRTARAQMTQKWAE